MSSTVIRENFVVKNFCFARGNENFLCKNNLPVLTYKVNIWRTLEVDENNIVIQIFPTQKFCKRN